MQNNTPIFHKFSDNESFHLQILNSISTAILVLDFDSIIDCNQFSVELLKYPKEEIISQSIYSFSAISDNSLLSSIRENCRKSLSGNRVIFNCLLKKSDGTKFHANITLNRIVVEGKFYLVASIIDNTENVITNRLYASDIQKIMKERNFYRMMIETTPAFVLVIDTDGKIVLMNNSLLESLSCTKKEVISKNFIDTFIPENERENVKALFKEISSDTFFDATESTIISKTGKEIAVKWQGSLVVHENGKQFYTIVGADVTANIGIESAFIESEKRFWNLSELMPIAVFETDLNGEITYMNQAAFHNFGFNEEDFMTGLKLFNICMPDERNKMIEDFSKVMQGNFTDCQEYSLFHKNGSLLVGLVYSNVIYIDEKVYGLRAVIVDITERKIAENNIRQLNESLEQKVIERTAELNAVLERLEDTNIELKIMNENIAEDAAKLLVLNEKLTESESRLMVANATKDKFFSIIAHDLKNPIGGIKSLLEIYVTYEDETEPDELSNIVRSCFDASKRTYELLVNLLEWARMQDGKIAFHPEQINIYSVLISALNIVITLAESKNIKIRNNFDEFATAYFDSDQINTVFRNLMTNAIKYSHNDSYIDIDLFDGAKLGDDHSSYYVIAVKDYGTGMDESTSSKLFRIDAVQSIPGTAKEKGTGLGLILCKEFVERHKGRIWVESEDGKGSVFYFSLPKINPLENTER